MKNRVYFLFTLLIVLLSFTPIHLNTYDTTAKIIPSTHSSSLDSSDILEGSATYTEHYLWQENTASSGKDLDIYFEYDMDMDYVFSERDSTAFEVDKIYTYIPGDVYQKKYTSTYYYASYVQLKFCNSAGDDILGSETNIMSFSVKTYVDKDTGQRTFCSTPYGAYYSKIYGNFESYETYDLWYSLSVRKALGDSSSYCEIIDRDAPTWTIGESPYTDYTVTGFSTFMGFDTVIMEADFPYGYDLTDFHMIYEFEVNTGLLIREDIFIETAAYSITQLRQISEISGLVDDGVPNVSGPTYIEVKNTRPITLTYTGYDVNYDHFNFYSDGVLIETGTDWFENFDFEVTPSTGTSMFIFEVVDSVGNNNSITTIVENVGRASGFTLISVITSIFVVLVICRRIKK